MSDEATELAVTVARREAHRPWWSPLGKRIERFVGGLPSHRDTRSGRQNAQQIRFVLLVTGILVVGLWESPWAPFALLLSLSALFLPISESKRRQIVASWRVSRTTRTRVVTSKGVLEITAKHATLTVGDERVRRLRRQVLEVLETDEGVELRCGKKKIERLAVCGRESADDVWVVARDPDEIVAALRS